MKKEYTPGPWELGKKWNSVVAPTGEGMNIGGSEDVPYYGGYLVAESVSDCNKQLTAAAPDLVEALLSQAWSDAFEDAKASGIPESATYADNNHQNYLTEAARAALTKAGIL